MKKGREYIIYTDKLRFTQCDKGFFFNEHDNYWLQLRNASIVLQFLPHNQQFPRPAENIVRAIWYILWYTGKAEKLQAVIIEVG